VPAESSHANVIAGHAASLPVPPHALRHHFADLDQQRETATLGMWVFLITEVMFFGGMFAAYLVYRVAYPVAFQEASQHMAFMAGTINTAVLICSSLFVACAVHAAQLGHRKQIVFFLLLALLLGVAFLGIKAIEYHDHWVEHTVPGASFQFEGTDPVHSEMFFALYFVMTGFHALHMVIGVVLVAVIAYFAWHGRYTPAYHSPVENVGLYWHFVDIIWIFLYPLLYLIGHKHIY
jgi:cytochrome c oxidase subunit 3